jgi:hypothetical protein
MNHEQLQEYIKYARRAEKVRDFLYLVEAWGNEEFSTKEEYKEAILKLRKLQFLFESYAEEISEE